MIRRILSLAAGLSLLAKAALAATVIILTTPGDGTWTVPQDFGPTNTIEMIGGASDGNAPGGAEGSGGGGGAYAKKNNLSLVPGASISYHIGNHSAFGAGADNTWFVSTSVARANGAASNLGGFGGVGDTKFAGGSASAGGFGGGGAGGPHGDGGDGAFCSGGSGLGGTGDAGHTAAGANGTQFDASHGSGGGGSTSCTSGIGGGNGGTYGAGGGGGDPLSGGSVGLGRPGIIVITYTPLNRRRTTQGAF